MRLRVLVLATSLLFSQAVVGAELVKPTLTPSPPGWPLIMSTYLGGSGQEGSIEVAYHVDAVEDSQGNVIIATTTTSTDLPVIPGGYQCASCGGADLLVVKLSSDLTSILGIARLGGSGEESRPRVALGDSGRIYVYAQTTSADFPTTVGAYSRSMLGSMDFTISAFDGSLSTLIASTYFGGAGMESSKDIRVSAVGDIWISGTTYENAVPTTVGAIRRSYGGGPSDSFVAKLSRRLDSLIASTLIGGNGNDVSGEIDLFSNGDVVIGVATSSTNYPTAAGAPPLTIMGSQDCAVTRISANLSTVVASISVGGADWDYPYHVLIDHEENVLVEGGSMSANFPVSTGAFDTLRYFSGMHEEFVLRLNGSLTQLVASTFLTPGNTAVPFVSKMYVDSSGLVYLTGGAIFGGLTFPYTTPNAFDTSYNGGDNDHYLMVLSSDLSQAVYSTFIGGAGVEMDLVASSVRGGVVTLVGISSSSNYPTTSNALYPSLIGGVSDVTVTRLGVIGPCCKGTTGNIDCDGFDGVDISDLSALIDNLYISLAPLCCPKEANVDGSRDGNVDISDLSGLIDFLYISFTPPAECL